MGELWELLEYQIHCTIIQIHFVLSYVRAKQKSNRAAAAKLKAKEKEKAAEAAEQDKDSTETEKKSVGRRKEAKERSATPTVDKKKGMKYVNVIK